jgi:glycosyltransferase involved in cell wall biosynthesis
METSPVIYSQVVTCHFEEESIDEFYRRSKKTLEEIGETYEFVFVNDGSTDGTYERISLLFDADPKVSCIIDFTRNYGQAAAITAGMEMARGKYILYLDSDLQLDPEDMLQLIEKRNQGAALVRGYRINRKDPPFRRFCAWLVNRISARSLKVSDYGCSYMLIPRSILTQFGFDRWHPWNKGRFYANIGSISEVPVHHHDRRYGKSGQPFMRLWRINVQLLLNASGMLFQYLSFGAILLAALFVARILLSFVSDVKILPSVTNGMILNTIAVIFMVLFGILCVLGEFMVRLYENSQRKPAFIIREIRIREQ